MLSARLNIRSDYEHDAAVAIQEHYGKNYDSQIMQEFHERVMNMLYEEKTSLRDQLHIGKTINSGNRSESHYRLHNKEKEQNKDNATR